MLVMQGYKTIRTNAQHRRHLLVLADGLQEDQQGLNTWPKLHPLETNSAVTLREATPVKKRTNVNGK